MSLAPATPRMTSGRVADTTKKVTHEKIVMIDETHGLGVTLTHIFTCGITSCDYRGTEAVGSIFTVDENGRETHVQSAKTDSWFSPEDQMARHKLSGVRLINKDSVFQSVGVERVLHGYRLPNGCWKAGIFQILAPHLGMNDLVTALRARRPNPVEFADGDAGAVNHEAYNAARAKWYEEYKMAINNWNRAKAEIWCTMLPHRAKQIRDSSTYTISDRIFEQKEPLRWTNEKLQKLTSYKEQLTAALNGTKKQLEFLEKRRKQLKEGTKARKTRKKVKSSSAAAHQSNGTTNGSTKRPAGREALVDLCKTYIQEHGEATAEQLLGYLDEHKYKTTFSSPRDEIYHMVRDLPKVFVRTSKAGVKPYTYGLKTNGRSVGKARGRQLASA